MSEQLRYIVQELNKEPFNKNFNLISFDSLSDQQLIQVLNDVFAEIDPKHQFDIREEEPDQTAIRMLGLLRVLKYKPPDENMNNFRQGLVQGSKQVVYPLLQWLLERIPDLKKRTYLAKFLVKVDVPQEIMGDVEFAELYQQYEELMENFKEVHRDSTLLQNSGFSTSEIQKDIANMEEEKEQLTKRIERLKRKVDATPKKDSMLSMARNLRLEREKELSLMNQKQEQRNAVIHAEQKTEKLNQQLKELKQAGLGATPEGLLQRLEEEVQVNSYIVKQKIPKELSVRKTNIADLQKVSLDTSLSHGAASLKNLNDRLQQLNTEINKLVEKRMMSGDPIEDKLTLFRQQAAIITRKKEASAEKLNEARSELTQLEEDLKEKQDQLNSLDNCGEVLRGEEFKKYVNKLRGKSTVYKKKRQELSELKAENGVLSRTEEILKQRLDQIHQNLQNIEAKHGVSGYRDAQEELEKVSSMKSTYDEQKGRTLEDMSLMVNQLAAKVVQRKAALAPLIKDLRPLRERCQNITVDYEEKKAAYDSVAAGLDSKNAKLEQEVKSLQEEVSSQESRFHLLNCQQDIVQILLQRALDEMKMYTSVDTAEKKKSLREQYTQKILEQERHGKMILKEQQKAVKDAHVNNIQQMKMWQHLQILFECKKRCLERSSKDSRPTIVRRDPTGAETMVF